MKKETIIEKLKGSYIRLIAVGFLLLILLGTLLLSLPVATKSGQRMGLVDALLPTMGTSHLFLR